MTGTEGSADSLQVQKPLDIVFWLLNQTCTGGTALCLESEWIPLTTSQFTFPSQTESFKETKPVVEIVKVERLLLTSFFFFQILGRIPYPKMTVCLLFQPQTSWGQQLLNWRFEGRGMTLKTNETGLILALTIQNKVAAAV